jgi:DNA topoisomerase-1
LRDRDYVRIDKKRLYPEDKGRLVVAFLESFFARYVEYDFTADLEEKLDQVSNHEIDWKQVLRDFWRDFSGAVDETKDLRTTEVLDSLNELLGPHIFPPKADGSNPRACPSCNDGQLSLKVGKFGAFIGCANYPECRYTRTLTPPDPNAPEGEKPGVKVLGRDPETGAEVTLRDGRFGAYIQLGEPEEEGDKPKRVSLPKDLKPEDVTLEKALKLLALPREVAKHPESGELSVAGIGRYGAYVQHGRTYANLGRDDDVLEIGGNRAIDLIVAKENGRGGGRFGSAPAGRALGDHPEGGTIAVKPGRFGAYVNWGKINATLPRGSNPDELTLEQAVELLRAKASGAPAAGDGKVLGDHPSGGKIVLREGRYGPYVSHGKINATLPKSTAPDAISLQDAIELIDAKGGGSKPTRKSTARKAPAKKAAGKRGAAKAPAKKAAKATPASKAAKRARG